MRIADQIESTKAEMLKTKPRSQRRAELEIRLRDLIVKQLRFENRIERRNAA
jgi:hypothetical protein